MHQKIQRWLLVNWFKQIQLSALAI